MNAAAPVPRSLRWLEAIAWAGMLAGLLGLAVALALPPPRVPPRAMYAMTAHEAGEWIALIAPAVSAVAGAVNALWILYHRVTSPRPKRRRGPKPKRKPDAPKAA